MNDKHQRGEDNELRAEERAQRGGEEKVPTEMPPTLTPPLRVGGNDPLQQQALVSIHQERRDPNSQSM